MECENYLRVISIILGIIKKDVNHTWKRVIKLSGEAMTVKIELVIAF